MDLYTLSKLDNHSLNNLLLYYDNWSFNQEKNQLLKTVNDFTIIFNLNDFSPFSKPLQAELILKLSSLDFSLIQRNDKFVWGLNVFESKDTKYLILESESQIKSSLLYIIAIKSGFLI